MLTCTQTAKVQVQKNKTKLTTKELCVFLTSTGLDPLVPSDLL